MTSPLVTLLALLIGLGAAVLLAASLLRGRSSGARTWTLAVVVVAVAALGVNWPSRLRESGQVLNQQRHTYAATDERAAREKCLRDAGRPDLVEALVFARRRMPEDAQFSASSSSPVVPCLLLNLFPRRPVRSADFDPARHWMVFEGAVPEAVRAEAMGQQRLPEAARGYLALSPSFVLVRPASEVSE